MAAKKEIKNIDGIKSNEEIRKTIHIRIFLVIIITAIVIIICGLSVGASLLTHSISITMETNMLTAVDIADNYVTKEIELLKMKATEAAQDINLLYESGERKNALERVCAKYPTFKGFAVFDRNTLLDSWGESPVPADLFREQFMQIAMNGGKAVSTTMYCPDGSLVMYVSAPMDGGFVLAAMLPGLHFSNMMSQFAFWQSGHLFIDDADGYVLSNHNTEWVQQRANFIEIAKKNNSFEGLSALTTRGIAGERGIFQFNMNDEPRMCAFRPVSSSNEKWFVGIIAPLAESELKYIPKNILVMGIITLVLSIAAAIVAAILLKRPYEEVNRLRRAAEVASISKSTFLANMSHEIRTPMNSIIGFSELAIDSNISGKTRDYLGKIQTNAEWLLQIINDILDISKIESGKMELENIPFEMHELFSSCRTLVMPKADEKSLVLYFYVEPSIGKKPLGDPTRLRQVLVNLLSNAIKFTNAGIVKLQVSVKDISGKKITMHFEVKDSGIGMTEKQIEQIFEPFAQAESGTTRKYGGTGLGLTITKNLVAMMGGELFVESTPGVGSKFSFVLTFDTIDISDEERFEKKILFNEIEKPVFEGEILLCEDNVMNQQVIVEHLSRVGLEVVVAGDGKTGVEIVQSRVRKGEKQFDLIFMDMHMPVMDGIEAAEKIMELNTGIPVIAMTANIMSSDREIYRNSGMADCVGKPFTSQELWRCLIKYLKPVSRESVSQNVRTETETQLLRKLQDIFIKSNQKKCHEIINALEENDVKLAYRLVHTLKGSAGQLGKLLLQQAAATVEQQLKDGKNLVSREQMEALEKELNAVLAELASPVNESSVSLFKENDDRQWLDTESARELFKKLESKLEMGNPECREFIDSLRRIPGSEELILQMENLDFGLAIVKLAKLKDKLEIV